MLPSFAVTTITVVRPTLVTDRGTTVPDWTLPPASETPVHGCSLQPGASSEALAARQGQTIRWTVYAPAGVDVTAHDAVRLPDDSTRLYQVDGEPQRWASPTGALSHTVLALIDWSG